MIYGSLPDERSSEVAYRTLHYGTEVCLFLGWSGRASSTSAMNLLVRMSNAVDNANNVVREGCLCASSSAEICFRWSPARKPSSSWVSWRSDRSCRSTAANARTGDFSKNCPHDHDAILVIMYHSVFPLQGARTKFVALACTHCLQNQQFYGVRTYVSCECIVGKSFWSGCNTSTNETTWTIAISDSRASIKYTAVSCSSSLPKTRTAGILAPLYMLESVECSAVIERRWERKREINLPITAKGFGIRFARSEWSWLSYWCWRLRSLFLQIFRW